MTYIRGLMVYLLHKNKNLICISTQWGLMMPWHFEILVSIGSGNGLSHVQGQGITWTNVDLKKKKKMLTYSQWELQ